MAQVSFNYYDESTRISVGLKKESDVLFVSEQIDRFIEFLRAQGFYEAAIFHKLDQLVEEFDENNPGVLDGEFGF